MVEIFTHGVGMEFAMHVEHQRDEQQAKNTLRRTNNSITNCCAMTTTDWLADI